MARTFYPTGQMTIDGTILVEADKVNISLDNAASLKGSLAAKEGIPVEGMHSVEITADIAVSDETPQVRPLEHVSTFLRQIVGFQVPTTGLNATFSVVWASAKVAQSLGEACVYSCTWKGHYVEGNM